MNALKIKKRWRMHYVTYKAHGPLLTSWKMILTDSAIVSVLDCWWAIFNILDVSIWKCTRRDTWWLIYALKYRDNSTLWTFKDVSQELTHGSLALLGFEFTMFWIWMKTSGLNMYWIMGYFILMWYIAVLYCKHFTVVCRNL